MGIFQDDRPPEPPVPEPRRAGAMFIGLGVALMSSGIVGRDTIGPNDLCNWLVVGGLGSLVFGIMRYRAAR